MARVWLLVSALPENSATARALVPAAVWSPEAHLLATAVEYLHEIRSTLIRLLGDSKKFTPALKRQLDPLLIDRPGTPSKFERRGTTLGQLIPLAEED